MREFRKELEARLSALTWTEEDARCEYNDILYLAISADSMTLARDMLQL